MSGQQMASGESLRERGNSILERERESKIERINWVLINSLQWMMVTDMPNTVIRLQLDISG